MSHIYNDMHKEQIFEQASKALDKGAEAINTLRDLVVAGDLPMIDYLDFMRSHRETWEIRLLEGIKKGREYK